MAGKTSRKSAKIAKKAAAKRVAAQPTLLAGGNPTIAKADGDAPVITAIAPFFIVADMAATLSFYRDKLGFALTFQEPPPDDFFAIVRRDEAMIMFKDVGVAPVPNCDREPAARWDAYLNVPDPDALAAELASRGVTFSVPLKDTDDGLRGFELRDTDGYVLFFGRPRT